MVAAAALCRFSSCYLPSSPLPNALSHAHAHAQLHTLQGLHWSSDDAGGPANGGGDDIMHGLLDHRCVVRVGVCVLARVCVCVHMAMTSSMASWTAHVRVSMGVYMRVCCDDTIHSHSDHSVFASAAPSAGYGGAAGTGVPEPAAAAAGSSSAPQGSSSAASSPGSANEPSTAAGPSPVEESPLAVVELSRGAAAALSPQQGSPSSLGASSPRGSGGDFDRLLAEAAAAGGADASARVSAGSHDARAGVHNGTNAATVDADACDIMDADVDELVARLAGVIGDADIDQLVRGEWWILFLIPSPRAKFQRQI